MWPVVQFCFSNLSSEVQFSCVLDTKFCLRAAGGIYAEDNLFHSGGNLFVSGSLAKEHGGAVRRSFSGGL